MSERDYQRIAYVAYHVLGCHPAHLYREIRQHPEVWSRHTIRDEHAITLLDAVAVADAHASMPEALTFPTTRPSWKKRGGKQARR